MLFATNLSEPVGLVDHVAEFLALVEALAVVDEEFGAALFEVGAVAGDVGRDQHVGHGPEWVAFGQRFDLEHVEAGAGDLAGLQRVDEVIENNGGAATDV